MTKLISGKVHKVDSANVSADRHQFIDVSEAEPDLGIPNTEGQVVASNVLGGRYWVTLNTANVAESSSNLYYTNARARTAISGGTGISYDNTTGVISATAQGTVVETDLTTANVTESASNLYYTNARVNAWVQPFLTTANVIESASNLYYTNARVLAALAASNVTAGNLVVSGDLEVQGNKITIGSGNQGNITGVNTLTADRVIANTWSTIYTSNVVESTNNLYYTNARVSAHIDAAITTSNIDEGTNLYYTNARVDAHVDPKLTTANVIESAGNLYFTNTRTREAISGGTGVSYSNTTGVISIGQNVFPNASVSFGNVIITGNLSVLGNTAIFETNTVAITDPLIQLGKNPVGDVYDLGFFGHYNDGSIERHAGLFRDASDGQFKLFANLDPEPLNIVDTANASYRNANLVLNYVVGKVTDISNHTTSDLAEGANLYYTNARARTSVSAGSGISYDNTTGVISANVTTSIDAVLPYLTTANVAESASNLYYTNARVISAIDQFITTSNVDEGTNLYYTNARVDAHVNPKLTTANVVESSSNLYYTNARVLAYLANANVTAANLKVTGTFQVGTSNENSNVFGINILTADRIVANIWSTIYTANVLESASNLYYTNARARTAIVAGTGISYDNVTGVISATGGLSAADLTTANVAELASSGNLYYTNTRVNAFVQPFLTTANVIEINSNLYYTNARVNAFVQPFLTTANVIESASNLYYTNSRVDSYVNSKLTTANVIESASNLYYTNARVLAGLAASNVTAGNLIVTGDLQVQGNSVILNTATLIIEDKNIVIANGAPNPAAADGAGITIEGAGANIQYLNSGDKISINKNVEVSGNLVVGSSGTNSNVYGINILTADRVVANIWSTIYTANVLESSSNLYYTNARARTAIIAGTGISYDNTTGIISATGGTAAADLTTANVVELASSGNLYYTNARVNAFVQPFLTTANVIEISSNLYFTNARAQAALIGSNVFVGNVIAQGGFFGNSLVIRNINVGDVALTGNIDTTTLDSNTITANSISSNVWNNLYTANVKETSGNLYYTNARVNAFVQPFLTTANVTESASNLYFTNARVLAGLASSNVTVGNLIVSADIFDSGNLKITASNIILTPTSGIIDAGNSNVSAGNINVTGGFYVNGSILTSGSVDTTNLNANTFTANAVSSNVWNNLYTANVRETSANLYYTNARVNAFVQPFLTTANVIESASNLYYTNARVLANLSISNVTVGNLIVSADIFDSGNLRIISGSGALDGNVIIVPGGTTGIVFSGGSNISAGNLNLTGDITDTGNLKIVAGRGASGNIVLVPVSGIVDVGSSNVSAGNINVTGGFYVNGQVLTSGSIDTTNLRANTLTANAISSNIWSNIYTANVSETSGNLYYTNARANAAITLFLTDRQANLILHPFLLFAG